MTAGRLVRHLLVLVTPRAMRAPLARAFRNARFRANTHVGRWPWLFFRVHSFDSTYRDRLATPAADIVIEGVPRVALTYCVEAFSLVQQRAVRIATHTHLPANVLRATRLGLPVLVVIREPAAAVRSTLLRNRDITPSAALERYYHFHRLVDRVRHQVVLADFDEVTSNLAPVIDRVNRRFGTDFAVYTPSRETEDLVLARLSERDRVLGLDALASFRPNEMKSNVSAPFRIDDRPELWRRCEALYQRLLPHCRG